MVCKAKAAMPAAAKDAPRRDQASGLAALSANPAALTAAVVVAAAAARALEAESDLEEEEEEDAGW
jgi:hypothetical protein